jgi:hypothetical protein
VCLRSDSARYELVSFFLNTKTVMRHLTQRMTDSFSEMLLKPTSLDVVQPEDCMRVSE